MGDLMFYINHYTGECECKAGFKMREDGADDYDDLLAELFSEDAIEDETNKECVRDVPEDVYDLFAVRGGGGLFASIGENDGRNPD